MIVASITVIISNGIGIGSFFLNLSFICVFEKCNTKIDTNEITREAILVLSITRNISIKF